MSNGLTIGFAGDFCLANRAANSSSFTEKNISIANEVNKDVDVSLANFEFVVTPENVNCHTGMRVTESVLDNWTFLPFDIFCLANNHVMDCGEEMLGYTHDYLEMLGTKTVGAGRNLELAREILYFQKKGFTLAVINVTDFTNYIATKDSAGVNPLIKANLIRDIKQAKENSDIVIVSIHSDYEFTNYPAPWKVSLSRRLAEVGADIIVHHHPHTLQGIEKWNNSLIAYSLGNFVFPINGNNYMSKRKGNVSHSIYLKVSVCLNEIKEKQMDWECIPIMINSENISTLPKKVDQEKIEKSLEEYTQALSDMGLLRKKHYLESKKRLYMMLYDAYYIFRKHGINRTIHYLLHHVKTKAHRHMFRGYFTRGWY